MDYSNRLLLGLRAIGQRLGVVRPLQRLYRRLSPAGYEDAFDRALMNSVRPGDVIWDIGAHVGFYSVKFAESVGSSGIVIAFEPSPRNLIQLKVACSQWPQILIQSVALSDIPGVAGFATKDDPSTDSMAANGEVQVRVERGDTFAEAYPPNIVKVDVEGYEPEVIRGMGEALKSPALRGVFVEVHFLELAKRGLAKAPAEIQSMLRLKGFDTRWVDPSHLAATRRPI